MRDLGPRVGAAFGSTNLILIAASPEGFAGRLLVCTRCELLILGQCGGEYAPDRRPSPASTLRAMPLRMAFGSEAALFASMLGNDGSWSEPLNIMLARPDVQGMECGHGCVVKPSRPGVGFTLGPLC